jgi:hypothetical protein
MGGLMSIAMDRVDLSGGVIAFCRVAALFWGTVQA